MSNKVKLLKRDMPAVRDLYSELAETILNSKSVKRRSKKLGLIVANSLINLLCQVAQTIEVDLEVLLTSIARAWPEIERLHNESRDEMP